MLSIRSYHFTPKLVQTVLGPKKQNAVNPMGWRRFIWLRGPSTTESELNSHLQSDMVATTGGQRLLPTVTRYWNGIATPKPVRYPLTQSMNAARSSPRRASSSDAATARTGPNPLS